MKLELRGITKRFGAMVANDNVNLVAQPGEIHCLLGENGAGKSTLMNVLYGLYQADGGDILLDDKIVKFSGPGDAMAAGIGMVHQHFMLIPVFTVAENVILGHEPTKFGGLLDLEAARAKVREVSAKFGFEIDPDAIVGDLPVGVQQRVEIIKALIGDAKVLIFDEPTAVLTPQETDELMAIMKQLRADGTAIVFITHKLREVKEVADKITVIRLGKVVGEADPKSTANELASMMVGRAVDLDVEKAPAKPGNATFKVDGLSAWTHAGTKVLDDINFEIHEGEILVIAGVQGNGQTELTEAIIGMHGKTAGSIQLDGRELIGKNVKQVLDLGVGFVPEDRTEDGLVAEFTIAENLMLDRSDRKPFAKGMNIDLNFLKKFAQEKLKQYDVRAQGIESKASQLSGGNQQKVVMARALMSQPGFILADEPTQGVDVGARFEIYRILREVSQSGTPVIVNSSDAAELEGLCDVVIVMSRGRVAETLHGEEVTESRIIAAAVKAQSHVAGVGDATRAVQSAGRGLRQFIQSDNATVVPLAAVVLLLGLYVFGQNSNYLSAFNISNILLLATALGFIAMGQTIALLMGGIDLSVGPLAGFLVVVASFFINDGQSPQTIAPGFALMFLAALVVGTINGCLIRFANFTPIAATLAMYIGLQGLSFVLRDGPGGYINFAVMDTIGWKLGPLPVAFLVLVLVALLAEYVLRKRRLGWQFRAVGSHEESARRMGVRVNRVIIGGYIAVSLFTALGAIMLMVQIGVGDPAQGVNYTLASITAVVLGGTSLRGGRGTFVGTVMGAVLLTEVLNAVSFLGLSQTYQYVFQGALILAAALIYSTARRQAGP